MGEFDGGVAVRDPGTGEVKECRVLSEQEIDDAGGGQYGRLLTVEWEECGEVIEVPVVMSDDVQFTPYDWTDPVPASPREVGEIRWVDQWGVEAIMLDGLPRTLGFDPSVWTSSQTQDKDEARAAGER